MNTETDPRIDLSYLDLMADGDDSMKKTMLDMLLEELPTEMVKLREAFLCSNAEQLRNVAHKMKSTLAFIGNEPMTEANAELEAIGKEGCELQRAGLPLSIMEEEMPGVMQALQDVCNGLSC